MTTKISGMKYIEVIICLVRLEIMVVNLVTRMKSTAIQKNGRSNGIHRDAHASASRTPVQNVVRESLHIVNGIERYLRLLL